MAKFLLLDASITVNSVNLSDHCSQVTISNESDEVDVTSFGASNKEIRLGLGDGTITATFFQDFASGSVDATLAPLKGSNAGFPVVVKGTSSAVSATNPSYTMTAVMPVYTPLGASVGEASTIDASFRNAAQTGIVRAIA